MTTRHFDSYTAARTNFRDLLDAAHAGYVTTVDRGRERYAVVDGGRLRAGLAKLLPSRAVVVAEGGGGRRFFPDSRWRVKGPISLRLLTTSSMPYATTRWTRTSGSFTRQIIVAIGL